MSRQSHHSDTCLAAVFTEPGQLELQQIPIPEVGEGEALVRITCCTVCGSDLHTFSGARREATPSILGHEVLGTVEAVGNPPLCDISGRPLQQNDRVTWSTIIACGSCDRCTGGIPQKCRSLDKYGHALAKGRHALSGGLAEFILLRPGSSVVTLDDSIPDHVACPVNCATATVAAAIRSAEPIEGQRVLILGAGMLGLTAIAMAKSLNASQVVVCDRDPQRLGRALNFGVDAVVTWQDNREQLTSAIREVAETELFDVVLELSGASSAAEMSCELGDIAARIVLVGSVSPGDAIRVDPEQVVRRWLTVRGVHNYTPEDLRMAIEFLQQHHREYPFEELVQHSFALDQVHEAFELATRERPVRVAIIP